MTRDYDTEDWEGWYEAYRIGPPDPGGSDPEPENTCPWCGHVLAATDPGCAVESWERINFANPVRVVDGGVCSACAAMAAESPADYCDARVLPRGGAS